MRQIVFANRDFEFDIARIFVAYYFDDFAGRLVIRRRLRRDFRDYDLIKGCRSQLVARDQNVLVDTPLRGHHKPLAFFAAQLADDAMVCPLQD